MNRNRKDMKTLAKISLIFLIPTLLITACSKKDTEEPVVEQGYSSCIDCHTNYAHLQKVYTPDTAAPAGGCGGEAPHYEPYDRVFMGGDGFEAYKTSSHFELGCTSCHGGVDNTGDKAEAHSGDFVRHPSVDYERTCGACHEEATKFFANSIHNGYGQMRAVALRSGYQSSDDFAKLPQHQIDGYNANCATCHGTCGNCHVVRPPIAGGGLAAGHNFTKTPDMLKTCVACHTSRGGHAYLGVAAGTVPDAHLTKLQFTCLACHSGQEMHGEPEKVEQRYAAKLKPECTDCHTDSQKNNIYHLMHIDDFNCQVCHSQDYNNCGSCHVHGDGARIPAYLDFKIAVNPLPELKPGFSFTLVRRTLAAPDNWEKYGIDEYASFEAKPTYNYTSPHNILKWTSRTQRGPGQSCMDNCHIKNVDGELVNKDLYLFQDDLLEWEMRATKNITVDGRLPQEWFSKYIQSN